MVLSNTLGLAEATDWIGQVIIESLLGDPNPNDYVKVANKDRDAHLAQYPRLRKAVASERSGTSGPLPLVCYAGRYANSNGLFHISVAVSSNGLRV